MTMVRPVAKKNNNQSSDINKQTTTQANRTDATKENTNTTNTTNTANNVTDLQTKQEEIKKQIEEQNGQLQDVQEELTENLQ